MCASVRVFVCVLCVGPSSQGIDVRVRVDGVSHVRRLNFQGCVETYADACDAVEAIVEGRAWMGPGSSIDQG